MKIYFAPNWGLTAEQMVSCYIKQTPKDSGSWEGTTHTTNPDEADYLIIEDACSPDLLDKFPKEKRLYFSREALDSNSINNYPPDEVVRSSYWDETGYLYTKWVYPNRSSGGINMTYDELTNEVGPPTKTKLISCVQSNKEFNSIQRARKTFIKKFAHFYDIDVFGTISCANSTLTDNCKRSSLDDYKYCLAFENQVTINNFFGTQLTDSLLRWAVPIYGGGAALEKYFPEKSFVKINPLNLNEVERVNTLMKDDDYDSRREAIAEARDLIINKYNVWPTINNLIQSL